MLCFGYTLISVVINLRHFDSSKLETATPWSSACEWDPRSHFWKDTANIEHTQMEFQAHFRQHDHMSTHQVNHYFDYSCFFLQHWGYDLIVAKSVPANWHTCSGWLEPCEIDSRESELLSDADTSMPAVSTPSCPVNTSDASISSEEDIMVASIAKSLTDVF